MSCFRSGIVRKQFRTPYTRTKILSTLSVADFTLLKEDWSGFFDDCFFLIFTNVDEAVLRRPSFKSGQRWRHTPEQCVAASTSRRYSFSLRLPSPRQTPGPQCPHPSDRTPPYEARSVWAPPRHEPAPRIYKRKTQWTGSLAGSRAPCPQRRSWRSRTIQVTCLRSTSLSTRSLDM